MQACVKQFEQSGFPCVVVKVMFGEQYPYLCGYVGLHKTHPLYRTKVKDLPRLRVHGGIISAANEISVFGKTPEVWWLGFECAYSPEPFAENKDESFVEAQCIYLANQLAESAAKNEGKLLLMRNYSNTLH